VGFRLTRFEHVPATASTSLVRIAGRWEGIGRAPTAPTLVIDDGVRRHRVFPLAGTSESPPDGLWRAAFAVPPAALRAPDATYALYAGRGNAVLLPAPSTARRPPPGAPRRAPATPGPAATAVRPPPPTPRETAVPERPEPGGWLGTLTGATRVKVERMMRELARAHAQLDRVDQLEDRLLKSEAARAEAQARIESLNEQLREARAHAADLAARGGP
jgi:hypothetical protein